MINFFKKSIWWVFGILLTIIIVITGINEKKRVDKYKKLIESIVYDVIETRRGVSIKYSFVYKSKKYFGKLRDLGVKYYVGDTCIIAFDSTNPANNYFVELKKATGVGMP